MASLRSERRRHGPHRVAVRPVHAPTSGPYTVGERYPFGDAERTYQVTVGFDWIAYAILLAVAGVDVRRAGGRGLWALLAGSVALLWFPHVLIAAVMVLNGS